MIRDTGKTSINLLRHDRMIVVNELRSAFASWSDRLIAISVLLMALGALHSSLSHQRFLIAASAITGLAAIIGAGAAQLILRRLDFHIYDGVLAAHALALPSRRRYIIYVHSLTLGVLTVGVLVVRPDLACVGLVGYIAGAGSSHLANRLIAGRDALYRPLFFRHIRTLLQRPMAGILAAMLVLYPLLFVGSLEAGPLSAFVGLISAVAVLCLTTLDDAVIRFMTISGYRSWTIVRIRARGTVIFLTLIVAACMILSNCFIAILVGSVALAALILMTARILVYRVHAKRTADTVVGICAAAVFIASLAAPMFLPLIVLAILLHLHRRSVPATWLIT